MLEHLDYKILDYVSKFDKVTKEEVILHFSKSISDIEYRFDLLCKESYKHPISYPGYIAIEYKEFVDSMGFTNFEPTGFFILAILVAKHYLTTKKPIKGKQKRYG